MLFPKADDVNLPLTIINLQISDYADKLLTLSQAQGVRCSVDRRHAVALCYASRF